MTGSRVLVTRRLPQPALDRLAGGATMILHEPDRPMTRDELLAAVRGMDAVIPTLNDRMDGAVFDAAGHSLRIVANYAVGYNNVDLAAAADRKIVVTNTPGVLTDATADLTFALILDVVRRVTEGDAVMRAGHFPGWSPLYMPGGDVTGATLGIFGFGRIGRAVARRARGFAMPVLYHQRHRVEEAVEREFGATFVPFERLVAESDILTIHSPLTTETRHRFGLAEFKAMKRTAYLVNTSRGAVVHEAELVLALQGGLIAGAGLDVYEDEPAMAPGLAACRNAVLAPHLGSATLATRTKMGLIAVDNVLAVLSGRPALTPVMA